MKHFTPGEQRIDIAEPSWLRVTLTFLIVLVSLLVLISAAIHVSKYVDSITAWY